MPLELNFVTVGLLLVAVVVATTAGGLIGRRFRTWREHRAARSALAALATEPRAHAPRPAELTAPRTPTITAPAAAAVRVVGLPDPGSGEPVEPSYLSRRLAGMPPPVVSRPAPVLGAATVAVTRPARPESGLPMPTPHSPGRRRRRRLANVAALACLVFAVGAGLGLIAGNATGPQDGQVLDAAGTPDGVADATESLGSTPGSLAPGGGAPGGAAPDVTRRPVDPIIAPQAVGPPPSGDPGVAIVDPTAGPVTGPGPAKAAGEIDAPPPDDQGPAGGSRSSTPTPKPTRAERTADPVPTTPEPTSTPRPTPAPTPEPTPEPTPAPTPAPGPPRVAFGVVVHNSRAWFVNGTLGASSWTWEFGDGDTSTAWSPSHKYAGPGTYTVTLTAIADGGATASLSRDVQIEP